MPLSHTAALRRVFWPSRRSTCERLSNSNASTAPTPSSKPPSALGDECSGPRSSPKRLFTCVKYLHFYWRNMAGNTLPLSARHLHPSIGPAHMFIHRLSRRIGALRFGGSRRDSRIAEYGDFDILVLDTAVLCRFCVCQ